MEGTGVGRKDWLGRGPYGNKRRIGYLPKQINVALVAEEMCQWLMKYDLRGELKSSY